jgi:protein-S-isoprenylcysteine O-methyltransferase Ste14
MNTLSASASSMPSSPGVRIFIPPRIFCICLIGGIAAEFLSPVSFPDVHMVSWPERLVTGIAIAIAGLAFMLWVNNRFVSLGTSVKTCRPATLLVTKGPYRFSRNPMYVGFVSILAGIGTAAGSVPMQLSALPMFLFLSFYVIPREEKYLRQEFGAEYEAYRRKVRRWL